MVVASGFIFNLFFHKPKINVVLVVKMLTFSIPNLQTGSAGKKTALPVPLSTRKGPDFYKCTLLA